MELDNLEEENGSWDPRKMKIAGIAMITLNALVILMLFYIFSEIDSVRDKMAEEIARQNIDVDVDDVISMTKTFLLLLTIPFFGSILGAGLMMKKSNNGWILLIIMHVIIILIFALFFFVSMSLMFLILLGGYIALTIYANKNRYKPEENFENYSN